MGRQNPAGRLIRPVTLIVVTWNALEVTIALLESLRRFPLPQNARVLFVDNGSVDGTVAYLTRSGARVIQNRENLGFSKAVNQGILASDGQDVVLLNNDCKILQPDWLPRLQATAMRPGIGVVGAVLVDQHGNITHTGAYLNGDCHGHHLTELGISSEWVRSVPYVAFACAYLKADTIEKVGLLDEGYFAYYEDSDYGQRVRKAGLDVVVDRRVCLEHAVGATSRANGIDAAALSQRSRERYMRKLET